MQRQVPIREVNQHLSRYIEIAEQGEEIIITKRGRPVARLSAVKLDQKLSEEQEKALLRSLARMRKGYNLGGQSFDRDELHER
ncbi:MAG: type II toxin-antitoxin system prevent-host-death family antitoxin [Gammaproteobacteria bacterium]|nr:type II toxin-antitoxin system prevent-host-death family antitoxin [Gammaproteobacteria bacterium]MCP4276045.1 type II toxin-antitoxin system prevent-host-death family antitoxin [Gammaproteobacteria bacterium]